MNNKKILILTVLFAIIASIGISSVNAITLEEQSEAQCLLKNCPIDWLSDGEVISSRYGAHNYYDYKLIRVKLNETYTSSKTPVKKDGTYQNKLEVINKVRIFDVGFKKEIYDTQYEYVAFKLNSTNQKVIGYKYAPANKGDWVEVYNSSTKTEYKNGKIYKIKYYTVLEVVNSTTAKKVTVANEKIIIGYYKRVSFKKTIYLGHKDYVTAFYGKDPVSRQPYNRIDVVLFTDYDSTNYYKCDKVEVTYKKIINGKTMTKMYKNNLRKGMGISKKLPSGYKPTKVIIYCQKKVTSS